LLYAPKTKLYYEETINQSIFVEGCGGSLKKFWNRYCDAKGVGNG